MPCNGLKIIEKREIKYFLLIESIDELKFIFDNLNRELKIKREKSEDILFFLEKKDEKFFMIFNHIHETGCDFNSLKLILKLSNEDLLSFLKDYEKIGLIFRDPCLSTDEKPYFNVTWDKKAAELIDKIVFIG